MLIFFSFKKLLIYAPECRILTIQQNHVGAEQRVGHSVAAAADGGGRNGGCEVVREAQGGTDGSRLFKVARGEL